MKLRALILTLVAVVLSLSPRGHAQDKSSANSAPYVFSTKVYQLPAAELEIGFVSKEKGKLKAPALPPANASNGEIEIFLKRSHEVIKEFLNQEGVTLPAGSLACYDPASSTLALRAMAVVHDLVKPVADAHMFQVPKYVAWTVELVEAPDSSARASIQDAALISNQQAVFERLLAKGKSIQTIRGETKSGQQTSAVLGIQTADPLEYTADDKSRVEYTLEQQRAGTDFEMEPTIGREGRIIDFNVALTHRHSPGIVRWDRLTDGSAEKIEAQWIDRPLAQVRTSISMVNGDTRLLGVWALDGETDPARLGLVRAAFFRANVINLLPLEEPRVAQILSARGEIVSPTPKAVRPVADPNLPPGMGVRRFRIPPDFLSLGGAGPASAADPFASGAAAGEPQFTRKMNVEEILRSQGIPFPPGSSANFLSATSELVVRNTPENLDLVASYVESIQDFSPRNVVLSLHIIQAGGDLIRKLERETMRLPDHSAAWKSIEEAAAQASVKFVRSAVLSTKSGQQASTESSVEFFTNTGVSYSGDVSSVETDKPQKDAAATGPVAKASIINREGASRLSTSAEPHPVGLRIEIEPTVGADDKTLDINLAVNYDFAPPVLRVSTEPVPEGTQRIAAPSTEFRKVETKTSTTILNGSTRMISVWKPSGTPELDGDVLQALFIRADIVPVEPADK